ncbi:MAG: peptidylprolyl isomerase, partial [Planctomycetaceae bacterium]|nr:peptidylprolyl isomerase [Planctomycetaceae bacterium]
AEAENKNVISDVKEGVAVAGLTCRIVTVSTKDGPKGLIADQPQSDFKSPDDLAFQIEVKNTSDKPIELFWEDRSGYTEFSRSFLLSTLFLDLELFDKTGHPLDRTERTFSDGTLSSMLPTGVRVLKPGEGLTTVLKAKEWHYLLPYRFAPGEFQARISYRSPPLKVFELSYSKRIVNNVPPPDLWAGRASSELVPFSLEQGDPEPALKETQWGTPVNGLVAALHLEPEGIAPRFSKNPKGHIWRVKYLVKNVSDKPISFQNMHWNQEDPLTLIDSLGHETKLNLPYYWLWPKILQWRLQPQQTATIYGRAILASTMPIPDTNQLGTSVAPLVLPAGTYKFHSELTLRKETSSSSDNIDPGFWGGTLPTGRAELIIPEFREPVEVNDILPELTESLPRAQWGPEFNGLRMALEMLPDGEAKPTPEQPLRTRWWTYCRVMNVSNSPITIGDPFMSGDPTKPVKLTLTDPEGSSHLVDGHPFSLNGVRAVRTTLLPGQVANFRYLQLALSPTTTPEQKTSTARYGGVLQLPPGTYKLQFTVNLQDQKFNRLDEDKPLWGGTLESLPIGIEVEKEKPARLLPSPPATLDQTPSGVGASKPSSPVPPLEKPSIRLLKGQVNIEPDKPLPRAIIRAVYENPSPVDYPLPDKIVADDSGRFEFERRVLPLWLHISSPDGKLATLKRVEPRLEQELFVVLHGSSTIQGSLVDPDGKPLPHVILEYGTRIDMGGQPNHWTNAFGGSVETDAEGKFTISNLATRVPWTIQRQSDGAVIKVIQISQSGVTDVQNLIAPPVVPQVRSYDETSVPGPEAKAENKNVSSDVKEGFELAGLTAETVVARVGEREVPITRLFRGTSQQIQDFFDRTERQRGDPSPEAQATVRKNDIYIRDQFDRQLRYDVEILVLSLGMEDYLRGLDKQQADEIRKEINRQLEMRVDDYVSFRSLVPEIGREKLLAELLATKYCSLKLSFPPAPTNDQIRGFYESHQADYMERAKVRWQSILIKVDQHGGEESARKRAAEAVAALRGGRPFAEVAGEYSDGFNAKSGGNWGWTARGSMSDQTLEKLLFELPVNETSDVVSTANVLQIVNVLERQPERLKPLDEVTPFVREQFLIYEYVEAYDKLITECRRKHPVWTIQGELQGLPRPKVHFGRQMFSTESQNLMLK